MIRVVPVRTRAEAAAFVELPYTLYARAPHWVPPLRLSVEELLDPAKNPFFRHARIERFLALDGERVVGRIAGILDELHAPLHGERAAAFGFFDCHDDAEAASGLFEAVCDWARGQGADLLRGPFNPAMNHECGLLVEGFDDPPAVLMAYNFPYYERLVTGAGFAKAKDLYGYTYQRDVVFPKRFEDHAVRLRERIGVTFRELDPGDYEGELARFLAVYNDTMDVHWGFVPMQEDELRAVAKEIRPFIDPRLFLFAQVNGELAGFAFAYPDINQAIATVRDGRLLPFGWAKLLWHLKGPGRARTVTRVRFLTLGVMKKFRHLAVGPLFYVELRKRAFDAGYQSGEASWVMEDNHAINKAHQRMGGARTKVYRIYERPLG